MGSGTKGFDKAPPRRKIYGDNEFHIRPKTNCYFGKETVCILQIRPSEYTKTGVMIEGEFGMGKTSLGWSRNEARAGDYKNTKFVYVQEEFDSATPEQQKQMKKWAIDGVWY
jgi:hypothetical protein